MKKTALLLALLLTLTGCQGAVSPGEGSSVPEASQSQSADPSSGSSGGEAGIPQPEGLDLPDVLFESDKGYSLEMLTPVAYDITLDMGRGGPRGFLTGDCFPLFLGEGVGRYALASSQGEMVTDFVYGGTQNGYWIASDGAIPMEKYNFYGLLEVETGRELTEFRYTTLSPVPDNDSLWQGRLPEGGWELLTRDGEVLFTLADEDSAYACGENLILCRQGTLEFYTRDQLDSPHTTVDCQSADKISGTYGQPQGLFRLTAMTRDGKAILLDEKGNRLGESLDCDYIGYFEGGYAPFRQNGLYGVIDSQGRVAAEPAWEEIQVQGGAALVMKDGKWGAIADLTDPKVTIQPQYERLYFTAGSPRLCFQEKGLYGLMEPSGEILVPAQYEGMVSSPAPLEDGWYLVDGQSGPGSAMAVSPQGEILFASDYTVWGGMAGEEDWFLVYTPEGKCGFMDGSGNFPVPLEFDQLGGFIPGLDAAFAKKDGRILLVDKTGRTVMETVFSDVIGYCPDTMVCAVEYTAPDGQVKCGLARISGPAQG